MIAKITEIFCTVFILIHYYYLKIGAKKLTNNAEIQTKIMTNTGRRKVAILVFFKCIFSKSNTALYKERSFLLRISSVNVIQSAVF